MKEVNIIATMDFTANMEFSMHKTEKGKYCVVHYGKNAKFVYLDSTLELLDYIFDFSISYLDNHPKKEFNKQDMIILLHLASSLAKKSIKAATSSETFKSK